MPLVTRDHTYSAGAVIVAANHNTNENTLYNLVNGNIDNANISASAAIADTKLASITTAGKVNVSALTVGSQATGDILYASSASAWARLGIGTSSQVLIGGTTPSWASVPLPNGSIVQIVNSQTGAVGTGSTTTPNDDSIPQITEGNEILSLAITPTSATNKLFFQISVTVNESTNTGGAVAVALHRAGVNDALAVATADATSYNGSSAPNPTLLNHYMTAPGTSTYTFSVRAGCDAGAITWNGTNGARKYGGVLISSITIFEIKAS